MFKNKSSTSRFCLEYEQNQCYVLYQEHWWMKKKLYDIELTGQSQPNESAQLKETLY